MSESNITNPPLAILVRQSKLRFIFFPYITSSGHPCIDAIVSGDIELFEGPLISESWFVFTCLYIEFIFESELRLIKGEEISKDLHPKKVYSVKIDECGP